MRNLTLCTCIILISTFVTVVSYSRISQYYMLSNAQFLPQYMLPVTERPNKTLNILCDPIVTCIVANE